MMVVYLNQPLVPQPTPHHGRNRGSKFKLPAPAQENRIIEKALSNELHPTPEGFKVIAGKFRDALKAKFRGRV